MPQKELITMTKKESERLNIINSLINGIIDGTEASKQMGVSTRQVRRLKQRVIKLGPRGIIHQSRGEKETGRGVPLDVFIDKHIGSAQTMIKIIENNNNVAVELKDTRKIKGEDSAKNVKFLDNKKIYLQF